MTNSDEVRFDVNTPVRFRVRLTSSVWKVICERKHPVMAGRDAAVADALRDPVEIRRSRIDPDVYLFYKLDRSGRWLCVVAKRLNGDGFVITAYPTDAMKIGDRIWTK